MNIWENTDFLELLDSFKNLDEVDAVGIGGSCASDNNDKTSDIDVYVFTGSDIPLSVRERLIMPKTTKAELGGEYFGSGDEFMLDSLGKELDIMYFDKTWFANTIKNAWEKYYPSNGYTTCFHYTLSILKIVYDKNGYLNDLQDVIKTPYPQNLRQNIIKRNLMLLKDKPFASYYEQIAKALKRNDIVSLNHRIAAFIASYFDILFAQNSTLHPGEKRLMNFAVNNLKVLPKSFKEDITILLKGDNSQILPTLDRMVDNLKAILN